MQIELEGTNTQGRVWVIRPKGALGTCGFSPVAWTAMLIYANNEREAIVKARRYADRSLNKDFDYAKTSRT